MLEEIIAQAKKYVTDPITKFAKTPVPSISGRFLGNISLMLLTTLLAEDFAVSSSSINRLINTLGGGSTTLGWSVLAVIEIALSATLSLTSYFSSNKIFKTTGSISLEQIDQDEEQQNNPIKEWLINWLNSSHNLTRRSLTNGWQFLLFLLLANSRAWIANPEQVLKIFNALNWYGSLATILAITFIPSFAITWIHTKLCQQDYTLHKAANVGALLTAAVATILFLAIPPDEITTAIMVISAIAIPLTHFIGGALTFATSKTISKTKNQLTNRINPLKQLEQKIRPAYQKIMELFGNQHLQNAGQTALETIITTLSSYCFGLTTSEVSYIQNPEQTEFAYEEYRDLRWLTMCLVLLLYFASKTHLGFGDSRPPVIREISDEELGLLSESINLSDELEPQEASPASEHKNYCTIL